MSLMREAPKDWIRRDEQTFPGPDGEMRFSTIEALEKWFGNGKNFRLFDRNGRLLTEGVVKKIDSDLKAVCEAELTEQGGIIVAKEE